MSQASKLIRYILIGAAFISKPALAAVSAQEAAQLGTSLTWSGAQKEGNADGSIPPYRGGLVQAVPAGFDPTTSPHGDLDLPDPYAGEKPLFSITSSNIAQYAQFVTPGNQAMFKKYPDYRMDVYPSHRSFAAPQNVIDGTKLNATRATTSHGGLQVEGAWSGIPFPIPNNGAEAVFNSELTWQGYAETSYYYEQFSTAQGQLVQSGVLRGDLAYPYYYPGQTFESEEGYWWAQIGTNIAPEYVAGGMTMVKDHLAYVDHPRQGWEYLVGERRLRKAPQVAYDNPNSLNSSVDNWDDIFLFNGALDRYTYKLVGKAEMYIPYNENGWYKLPHEDQVLAHFINPNGFRWEKHRVWIVDFNLAPGARHVIPHRRLYIDEDSWIAVMEDEYDAVGTLVRVGMQIPYVIPRVPATRRGGLNFYNLESGQMSQDQLPYRAVLLPPVPMSQFTPAALESAGVR